MTQAQFMQVLQTEAAKLKKSRQEGKGRQTTNVRIKMQKESDREIRKNNEVFRGFLSFVSFLALNCCSSLKSGLKFKEPLIPEFVLN